MDTLDLQYPRQEDGEPYQPRASWCWCWCVMRLPLSWGRNGGTYYTALGRLLKCMVWYVFRVRFPSYFSVSDYHRCNLCWLVRPLQSIIFSFMLSSSRAKPWIGSDGGSSVGKSATPPPSHARLGRL